MGVLFSAEVLAPIFFHHFGGLYFVVWCLDCRNNSFAHVLHIFGFRGMVFQDISQVVDEGLYVILVELENQQAVDGVLTNLWCLFTNSTNQPFLVISVSRHASVYLQVYYCTILFPHTTFT